MIYDPKDTSPTTDSSRKDWEKNIPIESALKHKEQTREFRKVDWAVDSQSVALDQQQQLNLLEIKFGGPL